MDAGSPYPFGATPDDTGANFALFSDNAEGVTLCLFDPKGQQEIERVPLHECTNGIWHCHLPGIGRGQVYGWRVSGPWAPKEGLRFNEAKLVLDPYARALVGDLVWDDALYGYTIGAGPDADLRKDERDSAPFLPKARIFHRMPLVATRHPGNSWPKTVIYEAHVRGLTMRHPFLAEDVRGTFAAISTSAMIAYLERLGITAIEFMPVQAFAQDRHLVERGLTNYWGYNTLAFFAPEPRYLGGGLEDIAIAVDRLHQAGIEVILDVVYNHTCEGNHLGPTLSWRGIDNASYYRLLPGDRRYYDNLTGCGNAINTDHPRVLQMILDSLRMWAAVYGIDGFRFDLATTLGRRAEGFDPSHAFFNAILQDPVLGRTKLIAEPWDIGPGGFQLGAFPPGFSEWNGDYRDVVRDFWVGSEGMLGAFASRFAASSDLFGAGHKRPWSSVNFITAHDGFTLDDLVSYNDKHNEANGEDNRDGHDDNRSWNCGVEGDTEDAAILTLRRQQKRNLLATLFLSQGVPMMLGGDELGNSQGGNNNAYCQDNEISWVDWHRQDPELVAFVSKMIALRRSRSALSRPEFLTGARNPLGQPDVLWYGADGKRMTQEEWNKPHVKCLTVLLAPVLPNEPSVLVMFNASHHDVEFRLPERRQESWVSTVDTSARHEGRVAGPGKPLVLSARSLVVWDASS
jgi:glycogen operon protein